MGALFGEWWWLTNLAAEMKRGTRLTRFDVVGLALLHNAHMHMDIHKECSHTNRIFTDKNIYACMCMCVRITLLANDNEKFSDIEMPFWMRGAIGLANLNK